MKEQYLIAARFSIMIALDYLVFAVGSLVVYCLLRFLRSYIKWFISPLWSLPGPRCGFLIGECAEGNAFSCSLSLSLPILCDRLLIRDPVHTLCQTGQFARIRSEPFLGPQRIWWKEAGPDTPFIHYSICFGVHVLMVLDADIVKDILYSNYGEQPRFKKNLFGLVPLIGKGLVTLEGKDWQRHRRIIHPSFQPTAIRESLGAFVPKLMSKFIKHWEKAEGREIDVGTHISNLALDIIGEVAFSHNFRAIECVERWVNQGQDSDYDMIDPVDDKIMMSMAEMFRNTGRRILLQMLNLKVLDFSTKRGRKTMNVAVEEVIMNARRKLEKSNGSCNSNGHKTGSPNASPCEHHRISLLERLLNAQDSSSKKSKRMRLELHELRDEILTFLMAGHDTTATYCYWAFFALCKNQDIQEKVFQDISKHAPKEKYTEISIDLIEKMPYFNAFMKEVLRLYPPAGIIIRYNMKEETLGGVEVPVGTKFTIPIHLLHRHPKYWENPDELRPERWLGDKHPSRHKYAFMPFSNGPRNCIGSQFAEVEAKLIMAPLIRHFLFRLAPSVENTNFTFTLSIVMKTNPRLKMIATKRD